MAGNELPSELVIEILAKLPVKDLVRFICVCKRWRSMLRSKNFIQAQMTYAPRKFLAIQDNGDSPPRSILYEQGNNGKQSKMTLAETDLTCGDQRLVEFDVIGHCDGLFCLKLQDRTLAVWNPLLRQVRKISSKSTKPITSHDLIGFGYDHSIDDYKIVIFSALSETILSPKYWSRGEVFTVNSSSRWSIDHFPEIRRCFDVRGTLAGNKLFWQVNNDSENAKESETILSFDLSSEKFEYKSFPRNIKGLVQGLVVIRGCLGVVEKYMFQVRSKVVVWNASNDDNSWSTFTVKEYNFEGFVGSQRNDDVSLFVTYKDRNAWNVEHSKQEAMTIFTYDMDVHKFIMVETNFRPYSFTLHDYVETLLSLN